MINDNNRKTIYAQAEKLTAMLENKNFELCSIINAKSGTCSEDCKWCAQSSHFDTKNKNHGIISVNECLKQAIDLDKKGIKRFSLVTSGKRLTPKELDSAIEIIKAIKANTSLKVCASMGLLDFEALCRLKNAGVVRYHCNLETSSDFFPSLCSTHTIEDKIATLINAKAAGMDICSGGIIGMGETQEQRIRFAKELNKIGSLSIPINILQKIKGTPLENQPTLSQQEILDTIAIIRIYNPKAQIRFAAGRILLSDETIKKATKIGVNSAITGDLLTTTGTTVDLDIIQFTGHNKPII